MNRRRSLWVELVVVVVAVMTLVPILWMVVLAFLPNRAIISRAWEFPFWTGNFEAVLADGVYVAQVGNSLVIVGGTVALTLLIGSLAGYGLSSLHPPKWILRPALVAVAFIPLVPPATLVPGFYVLLSQVGLIGSLAGLILVNTLFNLPFCVLLMASYFGTVPKALREAALVDGATEWRTLVSVILPLVRPGLAAVAVFTGIMAWNEFLMGLTMTSGGTTAPVTVGIAGLLQPYIVTWGQMAAAGTMAALPIIVLAIVANRQIVAGLTAGAVKG